MVGHAAVDVVLDAGLLGSIGQRLANSKLGTKGDGIDKGSAHAIEQLGYEGFVLERSLDDGDIVELGKFLGDRVIVLMDVSSNMVTQGGGDAGDGSCLAACGVDEC